MKYTLTVETEEEEEITRIMNTGDLYLMIWNYSQWLREQIKYQEKDELEPARNKLFEMVEEYMLPDIL